MAVCVIPPTLSPGFLFLKYTHRDVVEHTARYAFIAGVDLTDTVNLRIEADRIAEGMHRAIPPSFVIHDWGILNRDGGLYYDEPLPTTYAGIHGTVAGLTDYYSPTISFMGRGNPTGPGICIGPSRTVLFVGNGYHFITGQKRINANADAGLLAYFDAMNSSTYLPADDYGQQITWRNSGTVQWNAHTQRASGS